MATKFECNFNKKEYYIKFKYSRRFGKAEIFIRVINDIHLIVEHHISILFPNSKIAKNLSVLLTNL